LILGCTHYPFIRKKIEAQILKHKLSIKIVDSSEALSLDLKHSFETEALHRSHESLDLKILLTDEASHFMDLVLKTFPDWKNIKFQLIDLQQIV
jgi:glutamate racemase